MKCKHLLLMLLLALVVPWTAMAQNRTIVEIGTGTSTNYYPMPGYYGYQYDVYLYTPTAAAELGVDSDISSIAYNVSSSNSTSGATIEIWVKDVDASYALAASTTFATYTSDAQKVVDESFTTSATGWKTMAFSSSFSHEGGKALLVAVRGVGCSSNGGCSRYCYYTSASNTHWYKRADYTDPGTSATGSVDSNRSNIRLDVTYTGSVCFAPTDLACTAYTANTATLGWTENGEATSWVLQYATNNSFNGATSVNVSGTPSKELTGLTAEQTYYARVKPDCDTDGTKWSDVCTFKPSNAVCTEIGTGTTASSGGGYGGIYTYYNYYAYTQQLYTASELTTAGATAGVVQDIALRFAESTACDLTFEVYLGQTSSTSLSSAWISDANLTKVYEGTTTFSGNGEWNSIDATGITEWEWDGTSNIVVAIRRTTNTEPAVYYPDFYYTSASGMCRYYYSSSSSITLDANNVPSSSGTTTANRPDMKFCIAPPVQTDCARPTLAAVDPQTIDDDQASISWTENGIATDWVIEYATNSSFTDATTVDRDGIPAMVLNDLSANTTYYVHVKAICGADSESTWSNTVSFKTACGAITTFPWTETFESYAAGVFSDPCWVNEHISGSATDVFNVYTYANGTNSTHQLQLPDMNDGNMTKLVLPQMSLPSANYQFAIDVYRNENYDTYTTEGIRVYASTNGEIDGATELAFIPRVYSVESGVIPAEDATGWYNYRLPIPMSGTCYIILRGESRYGNPTYMDNFQVKVIPDHPLKIVASNPVSDEMTWEQFVSYVNNDGDDYLGKTVTLMENITVTSMVGTITGEHGFELPFSGTFEGNGHTITLNYNITGTGYQYAAPFRFIKNATIQNLTVGGTITTSGSGAAGLVGYGQGTNHVTNCVSNVTINASAGTGTHGGFMSNINKGCNMYFEGCAFTGTFTGADGISVGGFAGWSEDGYYQSESHAYFTNCVVDSSPSITLESSSKTFTRTRIGNNISFTNCYYVTAISGDASQGKLAHTITGESPVTVAMSGTGTVYNVSGITAYATGMVYNGDIIAGSGDQVVLALSGSTSGAYQTTCGSLTNDNSPLTMGDCDAVISQLLCPAPTSLTVSDINGHGATLGWNGSAESFNIYYGVLEEGSPITIDFETNGLSQANFSNSTTYPWTVTTADKHNGTYSVKSGGAGIGYATSDLTLTLNLTNDATISFWSKASSESNYDYGRFLIDGTQQFQTSGTSNSWVEHSYELTAGAHTLIWRYYKDSGTDSGDDCFYVDDITIPHYSVATWQTSTSSTTSATLTGLAPETLYEAYVVADCGSDNGQSQSTETVTFTTTVACPAPTNLNYSNVQNNSVELSWNESGNAEEWVIEYSTNSDFSNPTSVNVSGTASKELTGLSPETTYYARVKANCGINDNGDDDGDSDWSNVVNFTTLSNCAAPYNLAANNLSASSADLSWDGVQESYNVRYREVITPDVNTTYGFEGTMQGWTSFDEDGDNNGWLYYNGSAHNGSYCVRAVYNSNSIPLNWLISPQISLGGSLSFYALGNSSGTTEKFQVYVSTTGTDISNFTAISEEITAPSSYTLYEYDLSSYSGNGYVAIKHTAAKDQYWLYVDDITITATGEYGDYEYVNNVPSSQTIEGLDRSTTYEWQVQGVACSGTTNTDWSTASTFTTAAGYTVTVSSNNHNHGTASITSITCDGEEPQEQEEGTTSVEDICPDGNVTVTATVTQSGYAFDYWGEYNATTGEYDEIEGAEATYIIEDIDANHTLRAFFVESKHTLTIVTQPAGAGTVTVNVNGVNYTDSQVEVGQNGTATLSIAPNSGYTVSDCLVTTGADAGSSVTLQADNVTAEFTMGSADATVTVFFNIPQQDISFDVIGYEEGEGHWYLFTSPLSAATSPADVANLFADGDAESEYYDLYRFDQTQELEWRNYKQEPFDLVAGTGYLYANDGTSVLYFHGTPYDGDGNITITNESDNKWAGWNLVGNPYNTEAWSSRPYYSMNDGTELVSHTISESVGRMEGFFVYWDDATEPGTVTVSTTNPNAKSASLTLNVSRGRGLLDRAIVSFGNNNTLPKFQLNPSHTKVYIPREDRDYAIVSAEDEMGEMPVSFKAEKSGSYTMSVTAEGVSFGYLHLIDNKTGNDVDLLQTSSYTFDALDTDYASRFKLVFATGAATGDNFAFYSNGSWVIGNEGDATLQVIDVTGRVLRSERVNGCTSVGMSAAPGVYMLRLVNGDNVRVQKVVVR